MAEDKTKPHPLYWAENGAPPWMADAGFCFTDEFKRGKPCRGAVDTAMVEGAALPDAIALTWLHADALRREGYMIALAKLRELADFIPERSVSEGIRRFANGLEEQAPGEAP